MKLTPISLKCGFSHHYVLNVAKEMAKVDMEQVAFACEHDVVVVSVSNALKQQMITD